MKICPKCSTDNPEVALFCRHCGKMFRFKTDELSNKSGFISIRSTPSAASVWVDHVYKGQTPLKVPAFQGQHRVDLERNGYKETYSVAVKQGESCSIEAQLSSAAKKQQAKPSKPKSPISNNGFVSITCTPSPSSVEVDGKYLGMTPVKLSLKAGLHKIKLSNSGNSRTYSLNVSKGETSFLTAEIPIKKNAVRRVTVHNSSSIKVESFWDRNKVSLIMCLFIGLLILLYYILK